MSAALDLDDLEGIRDDLAEAIVDLAHVGGKHVDVTRTIYRLGALHQFVEEAIDEDDHGGAS